MTILVVSFVCVLLACTNTLLAVILVDLMGVENVARCLAIFNFTNAFGFLGGAPTVGKRCIM